MHPKVEFGPQSCIAMTTAHRPSWCAPSQTIITIIIKNDNIIITISNHYLHYTLCSLLLLFMLVLLFVCVYIYIYIHVCIHNHTYTTSVLRRSDACDDRATLLCETCNSSAASRSRHQTTTTMMMMMMTMMYTRLLSNSAPTWSSMCRFTACHL